MAVIYSLSTDDDDDDDDEHDDELLFLLKNHSVICYKSRITVQFLYSDNKRRRLIQSYLGRIREWITTKSPPPLFEVDPTQPKIVTGIT